MAIIRISNAVRNLMAQQLAAAFDSGTGPGYIQFYTAPMPASPSTAITTQDLLGTVTLSDPAAVTVADGVITFDDITLDTGADASGDTVWARGFNGDAVVVSDFDVSDLAGNGAIKLNTTTIYVGGPIMLDSLTITVG